MMMQTGVSEDDACTQMCFAMELNCAIDNVVCSVTVEIVFKVEIVVNPAAIDTAAAESALATAASKSPSGIAVDIEEEDPVEYLKVNVPEYTTADNETYTAAVQAAKEAEQEAVDAENQAKAAEADADETCHDKFKDAEKALNDAKNSGKYAVYFNKVFGSAVGHSHPSMIGMLMFITLCAVFLHG